MEITSDNFDKCKKSGWSISKDGTLSLYDSNGVCRVRFTDIHRQREVITEPKPFVIHNGITYVNPSLIKECTI